MSSGLRKFLVILGGIIIPIIILIWGVCISMLFDFRDIISINNEDKIFSEFGNVYVKLLFVPVAIASGLSFVLFNWSRNLLSKNRQYFYWALLLVFLPFSMLNYFTGDALIERSFQVIIDLLLVFLGILAAKQIKDVNTKITELRILKSGILFILILNCILIPGTFAVLWILDWQNIFPIADSGSGINYMTSGVGVISLGITIINHFKESEKENKKLDLKPDKQKYIFRKDEIEEMLKMFSLDRISVCIKLLDKKKDEFTANNLKIFLLLNNQWKAVKNDINKGILREEEINVRKNKVKNNLLELIMEFKPAPNNR